MANDTYDYTQDPDFIKAPAQQQHAYLMQNDPEYASADPKMQGAYISHLRGYDQPTQFEKDNAPPAMEESAMQRGVEGVGRGVENLAGGLFNTVVHPIDTAKGMWAGAKEQAQLGQTAPTLSERLGHDAAAVLPGVGPWAAGIGDRIGHGDVVGGITEAATTLGLPEAVGHGVSAARSHMATPVDTLGRTQQLGTLEQAGRPRTGLIKGVGRDIASKYVGPRLANAILPEAAEHNPHTPSPNVLQGDVNRGVGGGGAASGVSATPPARPPITKPVDPLKQAISEGRAAKIPTRMPKEAEAPVDPDAVRLQKLNARANRGYTAGVSGGGPATGTGSRGPGIQRTSPVGTTIQSPEEGVIVVPEPRAPFRGEQPGLMQSVPREELPGQAKVAKPGAAHQMQNIGKKILYRPKGVIGRK